MPIQYCACFDPCCAWCNALEARDKAEAEARAAAPEDVVPVLAPSEPPVYFNDAGPGDEPEPEDRYARSAEGQAWEQFERDEEFSRRHGA